MKTVSLLTFPYDGLIHSNKIIVMYEYSEYVQIPSQWIGNQHNIYLTAFFAKLRIQHFWEMLS